MKADDCVAEVKTPRMRSYIQTPAQNAPSVSPYISVAEDIEWFRDVWLASDREMLPPDLRRGSATLRRLLVDGLVHEAWHAHEMTGAPTIVGPDLSAAIAIRNHEVRHGVSVVAGGGVRAGVITCAFGAWRVTNPSTGIGPDAESGFAMSVEHISCQASGGISNERVAGDHGKDLEDRHLP